MLVWLAEYLTPYLSIFHVVSYLTFRAIMSVLTALGLSLWMGPHLIRRLQLLQIGQCGTVFQITTGSSFADTYQISERFSRVVHLF